MMITDSCDILIIGAGAAGMGAAIAARSAGAEKVYVVERDSAPGGVLNQCVHHGFGLGYYKEDLTGIEYARRTETVFESCGALLLTDTMAMQLNPDKTAVLSSFGRMQKISFAQCILASGCRERTIYSLPVAGTRPAGIFTAGTVQKALNVCHYDIADPVIILGTGDIGQVVARQLVTEGKNVLCMVEQNSMPGGMQRNRRECLEKYKIPVMTDSTITKIYGEKKITGVEITHLKTGEITFLPCAVLITALGLIPEQELISDFLEKDSLPDWLSLSGNCSFVHEIVDSVSAEAEKAGLSAAKKLQTAPDDASG